MALSNNELIFKIILPTIFGIAGIAVPLILFVFRRKGKPSIGNIENVEGDIIIAEHVTKGLNKKEATEAFAEALKESGLAQPIPPEQIKEQIEDYEKKLAQRELEREGERLKRAEVLSVRGTERLEAEKYEGAIEDLEAAVEILPEGSEAWTSANFNLGITLGEFPRGDREANLRRAIESYKNYLSLYTRDKYPEQYARAQNNLGVANSDLGDIRNMDENLKLAIDAYHEVLSVYTFEKFPQDYAMTQNNLGIAYRGLAEVRDKDGNLNKAIAAYEKALKVRTSKKFPQGYAQTQNNLGIAYWGLSDIRHKEKNLNKAIKAYEQALRVYTFEKFPQYYAATQNNLGEAYRRFAGVRDKKKNLSKAIEAYEHALRIYTFEEFPQDYAMTQNNLGNAYTCLAAVRDREENLQKATEAFGEALRVRKKETLPIPFAETSYNLAIALNIKGDRTDAIKIMEEVLPVAESASDPRLEQYQEFYKWLKSSD